jgi:inorganic pyrophosphatase
MRRLLLALLLPVTACWAARGVPVMDLALCGVARQPDDAPERATVLVEIPAGGREKVEFDHRQGRMVPTRLLPDTFAYPLAYGAFPCTLAGDGDPLDALVLDAPGAVTGNILTVAPVAVLRMLDGGDPDDKVVVRRADAPAAPLADTERERITSFFRAYKGPDASVVLLGWGDAASARRVLAEALAIASPP